MTWRTGYDGTIHHDLPSRAGMMSEEPAAFISLIRALAPSCHKETLVRGYALSDSH